MTFLFLCEKDVFKLELSQQSYQHMWGEDTDILGERNIKLETEINKLESKK